MEEAAFESLETSMNFDTNFDDSFDLNASVDRIIESSLDINDINKYLNEKAARLEGNESSIENVRKLQSRARIIKSEVFKGDPEIKAKVKEVADLTDKIIKDFKFDYDESTTTTPTTQDFLKSLYDHIETSIGNTTIDPTIHETVARETLKRLSKLGGDAMSDAQITELLKKSGSFEYLDDGTVDRTKVGGKSPTELTSGELDKINDKLDEIQRIQESSGKSALDIIKDLCKGLIELAKILGPLVGIWIMYNLISYIFSDCYWIPVNKNCKFIGKNQASWSILQHTKKRMPKKDTQDSFVAKFTFQHNKKAQCTCNEDNQSFLKVVANEHDDYGTINVDEVNAQGEVTGAISTGRPCDNSPGDDDMTIACYERDKGDKPMCMKPASDSDDDDRANTICSGYYEQYDCDLGDMLNGLADLLDKALHSDPLGFIKKIIYFVVLIIIAYVVISIIMYVINNRRNN